MVLYFYLRRGELPGCLLRLQRGVAPNAHRLALLYGEKQASKLQKWELRLSLHSSGVRRNFALGSGGTICLSPVDKNHLSVPLNLYPQFKGSKPEMSLAPKVLWPSN